MPDPIPTPPVLSNESPVARIHRTPLTRRTRMTVVLLCILGAFCLAMYAFIPRDVPVYDARGKLTQVSILRFDSWDLLWLCFAGFVLPLVAGIILLVRQRIVLGILLILVTFIAPSPAWRRGKDLDVFSWKICDQVAATDGRQYCSINNLSMRVDKSAIMISRTKSSGRLYITVDILGTQDIYINTSPYTQVRHLPVVRPTPPKSVSFGALYLTDAGLLVGMGSDNSCYLVYDTRNEPQYGSDEVAALSPFLLLDDKDQPYAPDQASILKSIRSKNTLNLPTKESLTQALTHANPAVRQSAADMLKAMKP
jgi:hypothetical protein